MRGVEFLASALVSGHAFGVAPGARIPDVVSMLDIDYAEQRYGRTGRRLLRRDYGLLEVTFANEPEWTCVWLTIEIQRLAASDELIEEAREKFGVSFSKYTSWSEVRTFLNDFSQAVRCREVERQSGFRSFCINEGPAVIRVVDDCDSVRGDLPGDGDVWGIEIR